MSQPSLEPDPIRLLCFDGGGVRGLASLCLLRQILSYVGNPKPCDYFDMIAGTSTGGLIAIMLGRLEMSVDDAIYAYTTLMKDIFHGKNWFRLNPFNAKTIPKYDASVLRGKIIQIIENNREVQDARFRAYPPKRCRTFVVARQTEPSCIVYFTDWERLAEETGIYNEAKIWEVALATTAASTFFKPAKIEFNTISHTYVDGGLGENNPVEALRDLAREHFVRPTSRKIFTENLKVILSIGTGVPPARDNTTSAVALVKELIALATKTQETHNAFVRQIEGTPIAGKYIRFNPPDLSEQVKLDEYKDRAKITGMVARYAQEEDTKTLFKQFRRMAEGQSPNVLANTERPKLSTSPPRPSLPFARLGTNELWIDRTTESYWRHMTLKSFEIYERIYETCEKRKGLVHYKAFQNQLPPQSWASRSLESIWSRLHRTPGELTTNSVFPKGFILAVTYMLHLEDSWSGMFPSDDDGRQGAVADDRREQLKRWPNWIRCRCVSTCRTEWNFANDSGLARNTGNSHQCKMVRWRTASESRQMFFPGCAKHFKDLKYEWSHSRWTPDP